MQNEVLITVVKDLVREGLDVQQGRDSRRPDFVDNIRVAKWVTGCGNLVEMLGKLGRKWSGVFGQVTNLYEDFEMQYGTLLGIQEVIDKGLLFRIEDLIFAEAFGSLLEQADYLLSEGYFLAAGVLGRAVLEEHLRIWCEIQKCELVKSKPTLNDYVSTLYTAKHLSKTQMKHLTALIDIGNNAAHNKPELKNDDVARFVREVGEFLAKNPVRA